MALVDSESEAQASIKTFVLCPMSNLVRRNQYGRAEEFEMHFGQNDTYERFIPRKCTHVPFQRIANDDGLPQLQVKRESRSVAS